MRTFLLILLLWGAVPAAAEELIVPEPSPATTNPTDMETDRKPILSTQAAWAGIAVIVILGGFIAAAVIGPIVRIEVPQSMPYAFSHHEDPAHHSGLEPDDQGETPSTLE